MNMIAIPNGEVLEIDGVLRTHNQIRAAFACCRQLELAYERASEDNGGDSSVRWEDVDAAREFAAEAISHDEQSALTAAAELVNGVIQPDGSIVRQWTDPDGGVNTLTTNLPPVPLPIFNPRGGIPTPGPVFEFKKADDTEGGTPD